MRPSATCPPGSARSDTEISISSNSAVRFSRSIRVMSRDLRSSTAIISDRPLPTYL